MVKKLPKDYITREMLDQAIDAILKGIEEMFRIAKGELRDEISDAKGELRNEISDAKGELKGEIRYVKDEVKGIKAELFDTPSRKEFSKLKNKVETHHHAT